MRDVFSDTSPLLSSFFHVRLSLPRNNHIIIRVLRLVQEKTAKLLHDDPILVQDESSAVFGLTPITPFNCHQ